MMSLFALAMNPNISPEEFKRMFELHMESKIEQYRLVEKAMKELSPNQRMDFLSTVLPILVM
jgi:hypothetical protein